MNETILNIGLNVGGSTMSYWNALFALMDYLPEDVHFACEVAQSNTEPTLIARCESALIVNVAAGDTAVITPATSL